MKKNILLILGVSVIMSSCVYSLFPIYTDDTLVFKPALLGQWKSNEMTLTFLPAKSDDIEVIVHEGFFIAENGDTIDNKEQIATYFEDKIENQITKKLNPTNKAYKLVMSDDNETYIYKVHVVQINNDLYLDLYPWSSGGFSSGEGSATIAANTLAVHTFYKLEIYDNSIKLVEFNLPMLRNMFKKNMIRLRHEVVDDEILITAKPKEVQKFIEKYASDPNVFEEGESYRRI